MFADSAKIFIKSGKGGDGHVSFRRELYVPNGGPDGGDGGRGGDVIFQVDKGKNTLVDFRHIRKYIAKDGEQGGKKRCHGADAEDLIVKVPEHIPVDKTYRYAHDREDLRRAMAAVLERADHKLPPPMAAFEGIVGREPYPVSEKARSIVERLIQFGVTRFRALFRTSRSRSEVVATFLAVLELCKANRIRLAGTAEDCTVTCTDEGNEEPLEVTVDVY